MRNLAANQLLEAEAHRVSLPSPPHSRTAVIASYRSVSAIMAIETGTPTRVARIEKRAPYSEEDDSLNKTPYKPISEIRDLIEDFSPGKSWWYKSCNVCPLREEGDGYKCSRYSLNLKVADEESYASFIAYETVGSEYLNISAAELRTKHIMRGGNRIDFPIELSKFKNKTFLFKVSVELENINSFQSVSITVVKLYHDEAIINSFKQKYSIDSAGKNLTVNKAGDGSTTITWDKHNLVANPAHFFTDEPTTTSGVASDAAESERWISQPTHDTGEDYNFSATKTRKVSKE
ncbi:uncharacterized protein DS421_20g701700 [Arachis hypogaea]|nr:uncharacterized protein DS421_20g701700 [Arachis hypogaea]